MHTRPRCASFLIFLGIVWNLDEGVAYLLTLGPCVDDTKALAGGVSRSMIVLKMKPDNSDTSQSQTRHDKGWTRNLVRGSNMPRIT